MAYTPLAGKGGSLAIGATSHRLKEWSIDTTGDALDTTSLGSTANARGQIARTFIAGLVNATVNVSGVFDGDNSPLAETAFSVGESVTLTLTIASGVALTVTGIVTRANVTVNVEREVAFQGSVQVSGNVTYP